MTKRPALQVDAFAWNDGLARWSSQPVRRGVTLAALGYTGAAAATLAGAIEARGVAVAGPSLAELAEGADAAPVLRLVRAAPKAGARVETKTFAVSHRGPLHEKQGLWAVPGDREWRRCYDASGEVATFRTIAQAERAAGLALADWLNSGGSA